MLVVTRKLGESIVVGDGIEIQVVSLGKNGVRIGVTAPRDIPVHRREVYDLVVAANRSAATSAASSVSALASSLRSRVSPSVAPSEAIPEANDVALRLA